MCEYEYAYTYYIEYFLLIYLQMCVEMWLCAFSGYKYITACLFF